MNILHKGCRITACRRGGADPCSRAGKDETGYLPGRISIPLPLQDRRQIKDNRKEDIIRSKVFVGNLNDDTTQAELLDLFSEVGVVLDIFLPKDESSGSLKGLASIEFADEASVATALEKLNGREFNGKRLLVLEAEDRSEQSPNTRSQGPKPGYKSFKKSKSKGSRRNVRAKKRGG